MYYLVSVQSVSSIREIISCRNRNPMAVTVVVGFEIEHQSNPFFDQSQYQLPQTITALVNESSRLVSISHSDMPPDQQGVCGTYHETLYHSTSIAFQINNPDCDASVGLKGHFAKSFLSWSQMLLQWQRSNGKWYRSKDFDEICLPIFMSISVICGSSQPSELL
jgi:hypothetical protein